MCVCVCLEGVHQECGKHISNEQIKASLMCFLILGQSEDGLWSQLQWWEFFKECGKHISESSAIIDNLSH